MSSQDESVEFQEHETQHKFSSINKQTQSTERVDPHIIIKSAAISSLSAINRLAKVRKNRWNKNIIEKIDRQYKEGFQKYQESIKNGDPNLQHIKIKERSMRKQYLRLFWIRLNQYGYPISKRIHNEKEGEMDDFNRILNAGGAILRDFFVTRYPLPTVDDYDYQNLSGENVKPDHPHLPSLDFAEIFRTHMQELAFTLFIRNVSINRVNKYFLSFFHACRDLADWIYAGGRAGVNSHSDSPKYIKKNFRFPKYIDTILRDFKRMIISENFQIGRYITPNKMDQLQNRNKSQNITPEDLIIIGKIPENSKETVKNYFTISSIDRFLNKKNTLARLNGDKFHKTLLYGLPQPFSLEIVMEQGERYNILGLPILIVAEIILTDYISTRRPDLMVFARIFDRGWQPIAILDVKTQFDYKCFIRGKRKKNNWDIIHPDVCIETVELSNKNWQYFGNTRLRLGEKSQLNELEMLVKQAHYKIIDTDLSLIKGIIRIAPSTNKNEWHNYQADMLNLIISVFSNLNDPDTDLITDQSDQLVFHNTNSNKKISMVLDKSPSCLDLGMNYNKTDSGPVSIPKPRIGTMTYKNNILYLFAKSNTSAGYSTAWIATYSHLIPHVVNKHKHKKIALIDLIGTLSTFTRNRLRTDKSKSLEKSLEKIEIINWDITSSLDRLQDEIPEGFDVYIFAGWESYKSIISHQDSKQDLGLVEDEIVRKTHGSSTIYWVDEANRGEYTSKLYHQRAISIDDHPPSIRSKIIFNLPTAPKKPSDKNPQYPDYRVIIEWNKNNKIKHYLKPTISLRGHTNKFGNRRLKGKLSRFSTIRSDLQLQKIEISKAYDLVPWLRDLKIEEREGRGVNKIELDSDGIEVHEAQYFNYSNIQLKLLNLNFTKRDWISRSKRFVDKSLINTKIHTKPSINYSIVPTITTTFPIHRNLLSPGYKIDDMAGREKKRLLDTIDMLEHTVFDEYKLEKIEYLKSLFEIIKGSIESNETLEELKKLIIEWELISTDKLSNIIQDKRIRAYYRHIFHSKSSPVKIKENMEFFVEIGNSNYLLLQTLFHIFPELTDFQLCKMWDDLLPYTLEMIGFQPKFDNLMKTQYNSRSTWYHLYRRAYYLSNKNLDEILFKRRDGFMLQTKRSYTWLYIENYPPILFYSGRHALLDLVDQGLFNAVNDEDLVSNIVEDSSNLISLSNMISVNRYLRDDYIWVYFDNNWILVGKLKLHTISTLNSILSFEITEAINYPPKPEDEPYEIDVEAVLDKIEFTLSQDLYLNFGLFRGKNIGFIDLDFYLKSETAASNYDFTKISAINGLYFTDSHKMINYLRKLNIEKSVTFGDQTYRFDPIENTHWMSWLKIKALVQSKVGLNNYIVKRDGLEFIQDYGNLLYVSPDELEIVYLELSHNLDHCVIQDINMGEIRSKVKILGSQRKYDMKLYKTIRHQNCFEISVVDNLEGFSKNTKLRFKQKYVGVFSGREISNLLSSPIQYIEDRDGVVTEYLINLELKNEEIIQEDIAIRILLKNNYQTHLKRRPPGSYRLVSDFIVTKIIKSPNGNYLELHYQNMITGFNYTKNILGDANPCIANDNWESNLQELRAKWIEDDSMGNLDISESFHYQNWMKIFEGHRNSCDDSIHELGTDELTFVVAKSFELIKEESLYSVILHVERTADTKDTEPLNSYGMNEVDLNDLSHTIKPILENLSHEEFISSIDNEFDLIYPQDKGLINDLHGLFCGLAYEVLDEIGEEFGENSDIYQELHDILDVAFLDEDI